MAKGFIANFIVGVTSKGLGKTKADVDSLGKSVENVGRSHVVADKAAQSHFNTQAKGIIGTANSSKSFSKLAQTMNSGGGVVGAYATLAANIFAVTAAFNALRGAAQTQQLEKGLEALGARTGQTLTVAAKGLREITNNTISMEQAMRSSAQVFSAGFKSKELMDIGKVANDVSVALGRNMTDSMDRLTRGVIKLEPELLDELGLMTRLGESSRLYAIQLNKSESSLSTTEKRQGFLNAILEEGKLKFGGLSDAAGNTRGYDSLAAAMADLSKATLNFINGALLPLISIFANNPGLIGGASLLFISTIKDQLLPGMAKLEERSKKLSENMVKNAKKASEAAAAAAATALEAEQEAFEKRSVRALPIEHRGLTSELKKYNKFVESAEIKDYPAAVAALDSAITKQEERLAKYTDKNTAAYASQVDKLEEIKKAKADIVKYTTEEVFHSQKVVQANRLAAAAEREALEQTGKAAARDSLGAAYGSISENKIGDAFKNLRTSIAQYSNAVKVGAVTNNIFAASLVNIRIGMYALSASIKVLGAALLTALPYLGLIVLAVGAAISAFKSFESAEKKLENKKAKEFNEVYSALADKLKELERANESNVSAALRTQSALTIELNAVVELAEKYKELQKAKKNSEETTIDGKPNPDRIARWWETGRHNRRATMSNSFQVGIGSEALELSSNKENVQALDALRKIAPKAYTELLRVNDGKKAFAKLTEQEKSLKIGEALDKEAKSATEARSALLDFTAASKEAGDALIEFSRSALPKTPFDRVIQSLQSLNSALLTLQSNTRISATEKLDILTGLSEGVQQNLSFQGLKFLQDKSIESSLNKQVELGKTLTAEQQNQLTLAQGRLQASGYTEAKLQAELQTMLELNIQAQEATILARGQNALISARLKVNQSNYNLTVVGLRRQMEAENTIIANQIRQLEVNKAILNTQVAQRNEAIKDLENSKSLLVLEQERRKEVLRRKIIEEELYKHQQTLLKASGDATIAARAVTEESRIDLQIQKDKTDLQAIEVETAERLANIDKDITLRRNENRLASLAIANLQNEISVASMSILTTEQQAARLREREVEINNARAAQAEEARKLVEDTLALERRRALLISRGRITSRDQLALDREASVRAKERREAEHAAEIARMEAVRNKAASDGNDREAQRAAVEHWNTEILYFETKFKANEAFIEAQENLNILETVIFNTREKGIEQQKDAILLLQQQVALESERSHSVAELNRAQNELERRRGNYSERTRDGEAAETIRAARLAYEQAEAEVGLRKTLIDLEFELLSAKDEALKAELIFARTQLELLNKNGEFTDHIAQLDRSLQVFDRLDREGQRRAQHEIEDNRLKTLRVNLDMSRTPYTGSRNGAFIDRQDLNNERRLAEEILSRNITTTTETFVKGSETIAITMAESLNPIIEAVNGLTATYRESGISINSGGFTSRSNDPKELAGLVAAEIERKYPDLWAWQHSSTSSGPASPRDYNSYHNVDQAVDINSRTATVEWNDARTRSLFETIVQDLRDTYGSALAEAIFNSADHNDHLHLAFKTGFTDPIVSAVTTARQETVQQIALLPTTIPQATINSSATVEAVASSTSSTPAVVSATATSTMEQLTSIMQDLEGGASQLISQFEKLGPEGKVINALISGVSRFGDELQVVLQAFDANAPLEEKFEKIANAAMSALSTIQSATAASADAKVAAIDKEIAAEQRRDGKSAESIAKIQAMERKKDAIARKAFETNKKIQMAQAIIATASAVVQAYTQLPFPANIALSAMYGALGAAQLAIIAGTSYQSTSAPNTQTATMPSVLSIGKRGDSVDLAKNNANAGGEIGYLRGARGSGTNASNYAVIGSAYGGRAPRGYGNTAFVVGEHGPETITPDTPITVRPANDNINQGNPVNATIEIRALDARGVEEVLHGQRGNIIGMLREAANANGQSFLENVDTAVYTKPNIGRL